MFRSYKDPIRPPIKTDKEAVKKYCCDLCEGDDEHKQFWDEELDFEIHRRKVHKNELIQLLKEPTNNMCNTCLRSYSDEPTLISHIKKYHLFSADSSYIKRELFVCDHCNNIFFNKLLLIAHIKYYHLNYNKSTKKTVCPACHKIVMIKSIWFHFLYHGIHIGTCPICLKTFKSGDEVLEHIENHPGYYMCNLCNFQSKNEMLFLNHKEKHKRIVTIEDKDVDVVIKYFVPRRRPLSWNRKFMNLFRGITLSPQLQVCVLCRAICENDEEMLQHIHGDHSTVDNTKIKRHICSCGEEFFNNVLLKHHIFTLKGAHKVFNGSIPLIKINPQISKENDINIEVLVDIPKSDQNILVEIPKSDQNIPLPDERMEEDIVKNKETQSEELATIYHIYTKEDETSVFESSKEYYERAISMQVCQTNETEDYNTESQVVYEVLEVPADTDEDGKRIIEEDNMFLM